MVYGLSVGSAVIAGVAATVAAGYLVDALISSDRRGRWWPVLFSLALTIYAVAVFVQYNASDLTTHMRVERIQYAMMVVILGALYGYGRSFVTERWTTPDRIYLAACIVLVVLIGALPALFENQLARRSFLITNHVYREPALTTTGQFVLAMIGVGAVHSGVYFMVVARFTGTTRWLVRAGAALWLLAAINDLVGSFGVPVPMYVMEYGYLFFLGGILAVIRERHAETVATLRAQSETISASHEQLEEEVARRTRQLAAVADGLRVETRRHRTVAEQLQRQMAERTVLIREIHHRSKNNLQLVSSLLNLSISHSGSQTTESIIELHQSRIHAMAQVHEQLHNADDFSRIDMGAYLQTLTRDLDHAFGRYPGHVSIETNLAPVTVPVDRAIPIGLWVNEVITNAYKHAFATRDDGVLTVSLAATDSEITLEIGDNGRGADDRERADDDGGGANEEPGANKDGGADDRERAAGDQAARPAGLGMMLIETLPTQLGGSMERITAHGTTYRLTIPATT